jgi:hypothetical protein
MTTMAAMTPIAKQNALLVIGSVLLSSIVFGGGFECVEKIGPLGGAGADRGGDRPGHRHA